MSGLRGPLVGAAVLGVAAWAFSLEPVSALVIALASAGIGIVVGRLGQGAEPGGWRTVRTARAGARRDAQELSWAMAGRGGRVGRRPMLRLRAAATHRLARHGLDLSAPADVDAVRALLGDRATDVLTRTGGPLPRVAEVAHVVAALERLGPGGHARSATPPRSTP